MGRKRDARYVLGNQKRKFYFRKDGQPANDYYVYWIEANEAEKVILETNLPYKQGVIISRFLCLNHQAKQDQPPLIFETVVNLNGVRVDFEQAYHTDAENALKYHEILRTRFSSPYRKTRARFSYGARIAAIERAEKEEEKRRAIDQELGWVVDDEPVEETEETDESGLEQID